MAEFVAPLRKGIKDSLRTTRQSENHVLEEVSAVKAKEGLTCCH